MSTSTLDIICIYDVSNGVEKHGEQKINPRKHTPNVYPTSQNFQQH